MGGESLITLIVGVLALSAVILAVIAFLQGRRTPDRKGPWVVGFVLAIVPAMLITVVAIASSLHGASWLLLGAAGLWALVVLTIMNPRWAAWEFIGSAAALPGMLAVAQLLGSGEEQLMIEPGNAIGSYSLRALVTAGLLLWATVPHREPSAHARVPSAA